MKNRLIKLLFLPCFYLLLALGNPLGVNGVVQVQSPPAQVTGIVKSNDGVPMQAVGILLKGTTRGVYTNEKGEYTIDVRGVKNPVLIFRFLGMEPQEIKVDRAILNVTMHPATSELGEIVVESTGYQDIDKRLSTSSVVTVSGKDVLTSNASTLDNMLIGKIPGMTVLTDLSTPGAAAKIRVRGVSTISGSREPLWVVDGIILDDPVPLSAEEINSLDNVNLIGNAIAGLNPQDIEKIDVLKDAAATAIYGVRAANGVIVITTKTGKEGSTSINYNATFTFNQRPNYGQMGLMNSKERIDLSKEIEQRALPFAFAVSRIGYEGALMDLYDRLITQDQFLERVKNMEELNTDWFDILFGHSIKHNHNVSVSGGGRSMKYYASGNYTIDPDRIKGKGVERYNGMIKLNFKPSKKIDGMLQMRVSGDIRNRTFRSVSPYKYALETSRAIAAYDESGDRLFYNQSPGRRSELLFNMEHELDHTGNQSKTNGYNLIGNLQYRPMLDLILSTTLGMNVSTTQDRSWFDEYSYYAATLRQLNHGVPLPIDNEIYRNEQAKLPYGGGLSSMSMRNVGWQWRAQVIYNWRPWKDHTLTINVGPEFRSSSYSGITTNEFGYLPDRGETFMYIDPAVWGAYRNYVKDQRDVVTSRLSNFISLFANLTYSYKYRYIFTYNIRSEGSNKFGQDRRARFLPIWSVSGRWNIHEEFFLKDLMWLNMLALRASYGLQGNVSEEQTPNMIMRFGDYNSVSNQFASYLSKLPNPNLRWEKNTSYNLGFETALFNNRVTLTFDYYKRIGTDQLINKATSYTLGKPSIQINAGTLTNTGFDWMVSLVPLRKKDWTWTLSFNGGRNVNVVTDGGINSDYTYRQYLNGTAILNGNAIDAFYSYRFKGLNEQGFPEFYGIDEIGEDESKEELFAKVFTKSGDRVPLSQGGIGTSLRWKDLSLNLFFSYSIGNQVRLNDLYSDAGQTTPQPYQNLSDQLVERWRKPGDEAHTNIPVLSADKLDDVAYRRTANPITGENASRWRFEFARNRWQMYNKSDLRVVDGTHLRLRSASLSYNVPTPYLDKFWLKSANLRLEGYNLFLLSSKDLRGQDPSQMTLGSGTTPPLPSFALSVNLSF